MTGPDVFQKLVWSGFVAPLAYVAWCLIREIIEHYPKVSAWLFITSVLAAGWYAT